MLVHEKHECFVMHMLYACVLRTSCSSSQFRLLTVCSSYHAFMVAINMLGDIQQLACA